MSGGAVLDSNHDNNDETNTHQQMRDAVLAQISTKCHNQSFGIDIKNLMHVYQCIVRLDWTSFHSISSVQMSKCLPNALRNLMCIYPL